MTENERINVTICSSVPNIEGIIIMINPTIFKEIEDRKEFFETLGIQLGQECKK